MARLDDFVAEMVANHSGGLRLHDIVREAVLNGFSSKKSGQLTKKVNCSLKKLLKSGTFMRDDGMLVKIA